MKNAFLAAVMLGFVSPAATAQPMAPADPLVTRSGWEAGGQVSDYRYEEPGLGVKIWGRRISGTGAYTLASPSRVFTRFDIRSSYGELKYQGSGTKDPVPDFILETRATFGRDILQSGGVSLSPYLGLGYRYLFNDLRGTTSTGAVGYRRYSNYLYVPVGLTTRVSAAERWVIAPTLEYDYFLRGTQKSQLTDANLGRSDANNKQRSGYGYRISLTAEKDRFAFGPWMQYWNIKDSDVVPVAPGVGAREPENWTREIGFEFRYRF